MAGTTITFGISHSDTTGVKSVIGSKPSFAYRCGAAALVELVASRMRVAVRLVLDELLRADHAAGAALVVDDRPARPAPWQRLRQQAADLVGGAAGGPGHQMRIGLSAVQAANAAEPARAQQGAEEAAACSAQEAGYFMGIHL